MKAKFIDAVINAYSGANFFFKSERNGRIQFTISAAAILLSIYAKLSLEKWVLVILCIGLVISLEMVNTAIEQLCNIIHPDHHKAIKVVKDVAAAAVLWASFISIIIGIIIFLPKLF